MRARENSYFESGTCLKGVLRTAAIGYREGVIALLLVGTVAFQLYTTAQEYAIPWGRRVADSWDLPLWERTALFLEGEEFAEYIGFLRQQVPEDARVILPPRLPLGTFSYVSYIQYYLFPRDIHNCGINEVEACVARVGGSNTFIIAVDEFPPFELALEHKIFIPFNDRLGAFAPK